LWFGGGDGYGSGYGVGSGPGCSIVYVVYLHEGEKWDHYRVLALLADAALGCQIEEEPWH
jgi:hypothetical protein